MISKEVTTRAGKDIIGPDQYIASAIASGASVETLERLMALKERHDANEAKKAFIEAMAQFQTIKSYDYLDLSASFDGWQQDCWFYQSDASHYAPYGAAIVAEEIRRTLFS